MFFLFDVITTLTIIFTSVYIFYKWSFTFWAKRNIKTLKPRFPLGNLDNPLTSKKSSPVNFWEFYNQFKKMGVREGGAYTFASPVYVPLDPDIIKLILTQDYHHFNSRGQYVHEDQAISEHLFALETDKWKNMRRRLTPTFTTGKMKMMFETVVRCTDPIPKEIGKSRDGVVNIKQILARYSIDVIGSCAFGIDCNSFENSDTEFIKYGMAIVRPKITEVFKGMLLFALPRLGRKLNLKPFNESAAKFFYRMVEEVVDHRRTNNVTRKDFMQLLIDLMDRKEGAGRVDNDEEFTIKVVAAQCFVFFIAGFETSSSTMTFCLYELSKREDIQDKVRREMASVLKKHNGEISYEAMMEMKYLHQVIEETLRMYPSVPLLTRRCTAEYKMPNSDLVLEKGMNVGISVLGLHYDSDYYQDPFKFDPDRFSDDNKKTRNPYTYLPFGEGPRLCIGMRFGLMQTKIGIYSLISNYKFTLNSRTKVPLEFDSSFLLSAKGDILLDAKPLTREMRAEYGF